MLKQKLFFLPFAFWMGECWVAADTCSTNKKNALRVDYWPFLYERFCDTLSVTLYIIGQ